MFCILGMELSCRNQCIRIRIGQYDFVFAYITFLHLRFRFFSFPQSFLTTYTSIYRRSYSIAMVWHLANQRYFIAIIHFHNYRMFRGTTRTASLFSQTYNFRLCFVYILWEWLSGCFRTQFSFRRLFHVFICGSNEKQSPDRWKRSCWFG